MTSFDFSSNYDIKGSSHPDPSKMLHLVGKSEIIILKVEVLNQIIDVTGNVELPFNDCHIVLDKHKICRYQFTITIHKS